MDELLNAATINLLRKSLQTAGAGRMKELTEAARRVDGLKLRARTDLISQALLHDLPDDYGSVAEIFRKALSGHAFTGWMIWPVTETVTTLALAAQPPAFEDGLLLLAQLTPRLTSEFAIRRFLAADLDRALAVVMKWTSDPDPAVRRLASEGTRPFLPWAIRVPSLLVHPESTLPILDALYRDDDEVVRRSVANHLNDVSRQQPELVTRTARKWLADPDPNTRALVRHSLRTLIKKGDTAALALMGFGATNITVEAPTLDREVVTAPGQLGFDFAVTNNDSTPVTLAVDYVIHYLKNNGEHREKVFKLTTTTLEPGRTIRLAKKHNFRPMTTRVHYAGTHILELQINGERHSRSDFQLEL